MLVRVVLALALLARSAYAADCDPAEAVALREHLVAQRHKASAWNLAWRVSFTVAAVGSGAVALADPFPALKIGLYASGGKSALGALARWFMPLRIHVPEATGDACADLAMLRTEIRKVAKAERSMFWLGHVGGLLVNLGGAAYIWKYDTGGKALLSIAVGYPIGLLANYTMPRGTWHLERERAATWTVTAGPLRDSAGWLVGLAGQW